MQHSFLRHFDRINDKYGAWLFYIGLFLLIVCRYWFLPNKEMPNAYFSLHILFKHVGRLLIICRLLLFSRKYPLYVLFCIVIGTLFLYSFRTNSSSILIYSFFIIAASKDTDNKVILKLFLLSFLIVFCTALMSWNFGWTSDIVKHKFDLVGHSWGFTNPNTLAFLLLMSTLLVLQHWNIKQTKVIWMSCWATAILLFFCTLSLTSVIVLLLIPLFEYIQKLYRIPAWSLALFPSVCLLASILLSFYYGPSYGSTTFESRFSIPALVFQNYGLSLFGQKYGYVSFFSAWVTGEHPLCVDNLYMHLFLCNGIIIALLVIIFLSHLLYLIGNCGHPLLVSSAIGITISGMMETIPIDVITNFMLLYYFHLFAPLSKSVHEVFDS